MSRKFLVIGCGSIGRRHLRNLRTLEAGELLAFDPSEERRRQAAVESGAITVASIEEGLDAKPDACLICSPSSLHAEQALVAASHCHLFIEKPIATTSADGKKIAAAVKAENRVCLVACNLRFHAGIQALRNELEAGSIGQPLSIRAEVGQYLPDWHPWEDYRKGYSAQRDLGGGVLLDAIHEIDLVRWLCGELENIQAICGHTGTIEIETEDIGLLIGRTGKGVWCEIHLDYLQRSPSRSCKVIGTEGTLLWDAFAGTTTLLKQGSAPVIISDFRGLDINEMYQAEMRHFLKCLDGAEQPVQTAAAATEAVRVVESFRYL
jgi:predicted dehydrogenase